MTPELIDDYIDGKTDFPTDPERLGAVIAAASPKQRAKLRRRIGIEMSLAEFGPLWSKAVSHANRLASCPPTPSPRKEHHDRRQRH